MKRQIITCTVVWLIVIAGTLTSLITMYDNPVVGTVRGAPTTLYVGGAGPGNYTTIQAAIDTALPGDTVYVYSGVYYEHIIINKSLSLVGESADTTVIDASAVGDAIQITADYVNLSGFNIVNSGNSTWDAGVELFAVAHCHIFDCNISNNLRSGIYFQSATDNLIETCTISANEWAGLWLTATSINNKVYLSNIEANVAYGVYAWMDSPFEATYNWWGAPSGPYHPVNNTDGSGDNVTDAVNFARWLALPVRPGITHIIDDWYITTEVLRADETIVLMGNLTVGAGGNLTLSGVNFILDNLPECQYHIEIEEDGTLQVLADTKITDSVRDRDDWSEADYKYAFQVSSGATLIVSDCELRECEMIRIETSNTVITNSLFTNNTVGITYVNSTSHIIQNTRFINILYDGVRAINTSAGIVINCTINNVSGYDFNLSACSELTLVNTSFNATKLYIEDPNSTLTVKNYLHVLVTDANNVPLAGADVEVEDNGRVIYRTAGYGGTDPKTDLSGYCRWIAVTDRIYYGSVVATENITKVWISANGVETAKLDIPMATSHVEHFVLTTSPTVSIFTPNRGQVWSGTKTILWTCTDPEGDELTYNIEYSPTNGTYWVSLVTGLPAATTEYEWDTTSSPDSTMYTLRVSATDGTTWGSARCNMTFTIANADHNVIEFADATVDKTLTYYYAYNQTVYVKLPLNSEVIDATMDLAGGMLEGNLIVDAEDASMVTRTGVWTKTTIAPYTYLWSETIGSKLYYTFTSYCIYVTIVKRIYGGYLGVIVDGEEYPYISCYVPYGVTAEEIAINTSMPDVTHTIELYVTGISGPKDDEVYVDKFRSYISPSYPNSPSLDLGADNTLEWQYSGAFDTIVTTDDFATALNAYLATHLDEDDGVLDGYITVPIRFYSSSPGKLRLLNLNIRYNSLPTLINGNVTPMEGDVFTGFNYTVVYYDYGNDPPAYVNLTIDTSNYTMVPVNPSDTNYFDGKLYYYNTTLDVGSYTYCFTTSDHVNFYATPIYDGPYVTPGPLDSITISPSSWTLGVGESKRFIAIGYDALGNAFAISPSWSTNGGGSITGDGVFLADELGTWTIYATESGITATATVTVVIGPLHHIVVLPATVTLTADDTLQFTATGYDAGGNVVPITPTWAVSGGGIIDGFGVFWANVVGSWVVYANDSGISGTAIVNVIHGALHTIVVTPGTWSMTTDDTMQFEATGYDADGNIITPIYPVWSTTGGGIINSTGMFIANTVGDWVIYANLSGVSGSAVVTVQPGRLDHFYIMPVASPQMADLAFPITVVAKDMDNNTKSDFTGYATLTASTGTVTPTVLGPFTAGEWTGTVNLDSPATDVTLCVTNTSGLDIVIVLDNSISMSGSRFAILKSRALELIAKLGPADRCALLAFGPEGESWPGESPYLYYELTPMDAENKSELATVIQSLNASYNTPLWDTIGDAVNLVLNNYTATSVPIVIVMTDGIDFGGPERYDAPPGYTPTWWEHWTTKSSAQLGFETGSELYCAWHSWGETQTYTTRVGEYYITNVHWGLTNLSTHTGNYSLTDSVEGDYDNDTIVIIELSDPISLAGYSSATLTFYERYSIASGDWCQVELSTDNGNNWESIIPAYNGTSLSWAPRTISLDAYMGDPTVKLRFKLVTDSTNVSDGWYIDDVMVLADFSVIFTDDFESGYAKWSDETHILEVPRGGFTLGTRYGLLSAPVLVYTFGFSVPHHEPMRTNTSEYDLYNIATSSRFGKCVGAYYYEPTAEELVEIYEQIIANATALGVSNKFTVVPATPELDHFYFKPIGEEQIAGSPFMITIIAKDRYNETVTGFVIAVSLSDPTGTLSPTMTTPFSAGMWSGTVTITKAASGIRITATAGDISGISNEFTVIHTELASIVVIPSNCTVTADDTIEFTACGYDIYGNEVTIVPSWSVSGGGTITSTGVFDAVVVGTWMVYANVSTVSGNATVTVTPGALAHIIITPEDTTIIAGDTLQYVATGYDADGNLVTIAPTWTVTGGGTIDSATGEFVATTAGSWTVYASYLTIVGSTSLTVVAGTLTTITIVPEFSTITTDECELFNAIGYDMYGNEVTFVPMWTVTGGGIIDNEGLFVATEIGNWSVFATDTTTGVVGIAYVNVTLGAPHHIVVTPAYLEISIETTYQFIAACYDADNNTFALDATDFSWSVTGGGVITSTGKFTADIVGTWTIYANYSVSVSGSATVKVTPGALVSIEVTPSSWSMTTDDTVQFIATGYDKYGNVVSFTVHWAVSGGGIINTTGYFIAMRVGTWLVFANDTTGTVTGTAELTIYPGNLAQIVIEPGEVTLTADDTVQFTATGYDADGNIVAITPTWSLTGGGTISTTGFFVAAQVGDWLVYGNSSTVSGVAKVKVLPGALVEIVVVPSSYTMSADEYTQFVATGYDADGNIVTITPSWSVSGGGTIDELTGVFVADIVGSWTVYANYTGITGTATVIVTPGALHHIIVSPSVCELTADESQQFNATGYDADGNTITLDAPSWSASGGGTITSTGVFDAVVVGTWVVYAKYSGISGSATVIISPGALDLILITPETWSMTADDYVVFSAEGYDADWNNITISPEWAVSGGGSITTTGVFTATTVGTWVVYANQSGVSGTAIVTIVAGALAQIIVTPSSWIMTADESKQFVATGYDADYNEIAITVTWSCTGGGTINELGIFTATLVGDWVIYANHSSFSGCAAVTILPGVLYCIVVEPEHCNMTTDDSQQFSATGYDSDGNVVTIAPTWAVDGGGVISSTGLFVADTVGNWLVFANQSGICGLATITITVGALDHIVISPASYTMTADDTVQFTAVGYDADNNVVPIAPNWSVTGGGNIDATTGLFIANVVGTWIVYASYSGIVGIATVTIEPGALNTILITPSFWSMTADDTVQFTATGYDADNNEVLIAPSWSVSGGGGTITATGLYSPVRVGAWMIYANYTGISGVATVIVSPGALYRIVVSPSVYTMTADDTIELIAEGYDADDNPAEFVPSWSISGGGSIAVTDGAGALFIADIAGVWLIYANHSGVSGYATITVTHGVLVNIVVSPAEWLMTADEYVQFTATGYDGDGNAFSIAPSWSVSGDSAIAGTIDADGVYSAKQVGTWVIYANLSGCTGSATVTVVPGVLASISVIPNSVTLTADDTVQFYAEGYDADDNYISISVTWAVDGIGGTIDSTGLFTAIRVGTWQIYANTTGLSGVAVVTIVHGALVQITVTPSSYVMCAGETVQYTATGYDADNNAFSIVPTSWSVSGEGGVIDATGMFEARKVGTWYINATLSGITGSAICTVMHGALYSIHVTPATCTITADDTVQFYAIGYDAYNNSFSILPTWSVSGGGIITSTGLFDAHQVGTWLVYATESGISGIATVTILAGVLSAIEVLPTSCTITADELVQFVAIGYDADNNEVTGIVPSWTVFGNGGTISSTGVFDAVVVGTWIVYANYSGVSGSATVTITPGQLHHIIISPTNWVMTADEEVQFVATGYDADNNAIVISVSWSVVGGGTIDTTGLFTAVKVGTWTVFAECGGIIASTTVTVIAGAVHYILVTPVGVTITADETVQFSATCYDADGNIVSGVTLSWAVNGGGTIDSTGLFTAVHTGTWTVYANYSGVSGIVTVTVVAGNIHHILVEPGSWLMTADDTKQFIAIGYDADNNEIGIITPSWSVSGGGIIDAAGVFIATTAGNWTIHAMVYGLDAYALVTVLPGALARILVTPARWTMTADETVKFTAIGYDADGNIVSFHASWAVSGGSGTIVDGIYSPTLAGTWTIYANCSTISGSAIVTVHPGVLTYIEVSPATCTILLNETVQFVARGYDRHRNVVIFTPSWSLSDDRSGSITVQGLFTPANPGTWTVYATYPQLNISGSAVVQVIDVVIPPRASCTSSYDFDALVGETIDITVEITGDYWQVITLTVNYGSGTTIFAELLRAEVTDIDGLGVSAQQFQKLTLPITIESSTVYTVAIRYIGDPGTTAVRVLIEYGTYLATDWYVFDVEEGYAGKWQERLFCLNDKFIASGIVKFSSQSFDPDGELVAHSWSFGDGDELVVQHPSVVHHYKRSGTYDVQLTVEDDDGLTATHTFTVNVSIDLDHDGLLDVEEAALGTNPYSEDTDRDGLIDSHDPYPLDPFNGGDNDHDGLADTYDPDDDNDCIIDDHDSYPLDHDNDGIIDSEDTDDDADGRLDLDRDGVEDGYETYDYDMDNDNVLDWIDKVNATATPDSDTDLDGIPDAYDLLPYDHDNDGIIDDVDDDDDNDGLIEVSAEHTRAHPTSWSILGYDPYPYDCDNDGIPDNIDLDTDNDGIGNWLDPFPYDHDDDRLNDTIDPDDDNDGMPDRFDPYLEDLDNDGTVDYVDLDYLATVRAERIEALQPFEKVPETEAPIEEPQPSPEEVKNVTIIEEKPGLYR
jgi:hypothetical protein